MRSTTLVLIPPALLLSLYFYFVQPQRLFRGYLCMAFLNMRSTFASVFSADSCASRAILLASAASALAALAARKASAA